MNILIFLKINHKRNRARNGLPCHRSHRRARNAHLRHAKQPKDKDRVKYDIDNRARSLRNHNIEGSARRL